jgi:hypothetical protein
MNIETSARVSPRSGKDGSTRIAMSETQSSNDDTLDEIVPMGSTFFSTDEAVRYDEVCNNMNVKMRNSFEYAKIRRLTCNFFLKFDPILGATL